MGSQDQLIDLLVDEGLVSPGAVDELRKAHGDAAATKLVAEDIIDEDLVLQYLSLLFDCPPAGYSDGLFVERPLIERLGADLVREYEILPVRRRGNERIDVVVVEPLNDLAQQILNKHFDLPIRQYVWPRIRFLQARHFFLGDPLPMWSRDYLRDHPVTLGYATPDDKIDISEALKSSTSLRVSEWEPQDVHSFIDDCFDRDTLLKVLLGFAGKWLTNRLIVVFGKGGIQPYFMEEWPELEDRFDEVDQLRKIKVEIASGTGLRDSDSWLSGACDDLGLTELFEALDVPSPNLVVTIPVQIGGRTAMSLLGVPTDREAGLRLDALSEDFNLNALQSATDSVGAQLEEMIKRAKSGSLPPPAERIPSLPKPKIQVGLGFEDSLVEQEIARRKQGQKDHRWGIVDISQVMEESSVVEDSVAEDSVAEDSEPQPENHDSSVVGAVADALSPREQRPNPGQPSEPRPEAKPVDDLPDSEPDVGATSYGMPTLDEMEMESETLLNNESSSTSEREAQPESSVAKDSSKVDEGWSDILGDVPDADKDSVSQEQKVDSEDSDAIIDEAISNPGTKVGGDSSVSVEGRPPRSTPMPDPLDSEATQSNPDPINDPPTSEPLVTVSDDSSGPESSSESNDDVTSASEVDANLQTTDLPPADDDSDSEIEEPHVPGAPAGLNIPTDASGIPMAQILRRPKSLRAQTSSAATDSSTASDQSRTDKSTDYKNKEEETTGSVTGRTMMGVGELPDLDKSSNPLVEESSGSVAKADSETWLDDAENEGETSESENRPGGTVQMDAESARTQTFGELLEDMESETLSDSVKKNTDHDRPQTIPVDAIEELESGPMAVEVEESLSLIDSRDQDTAFAAAEHLAVAGTSALKGLHPLFPGRIFVDRYQYTVETMPPINEHGPVLEALVRIGEPSLLIADAYIDDPSLECRFYATYLLTELPATSLIQKLRERLFDRDQQTRTIARNIIHAHRHIDGFEDKVIAHLRDILEEDDEEFRVEIAAKNIRLFKDLASVPLLIDALQEHTDRVRDAVHRALREITFQPLSPSPSEWRRWWFDAQQQQRWEWLVDAMNSDDKNIRLLAFDEIEQLPGLELDYHPDQPSKLRGRAQGQLKTFFEEKK